MAFKDGNRGEDYVKGKIKILEHKGHQIFEEQEWHSKANRI